MTIERETTSDLFGLAGSLPRPGWVVLDAARDHRYTGELIFDVLPEVRIYFDRGEIYLAERVTDPPLGPRLVDAGALSAVQLEHGSIRVGDDRSEHLGRLFERVPSVDRHAVLITTELMNDECVAWVARQNVAAVESTPYAHHPSGVHRWERPADGVDLQPGDPLPAPQPSSSPVDLHPPEPLFDIDAADAMIQWDEPSWLDGRSRTPQSPSVAPGPTAPSEAAPIQGAAAEPPAVPPDASIMQTDWIDRFETEGLPDEGRDPLVAPAELPHVAAEPIDHFEIIWPSGEIDDDFGGLTAVEPDRDPDRDRPGLTAKVTRASTPEPEPEPESEFQSEPDRPVTTIEPPGPVAATMFVPDDDDEPLGDDVVLAVRRAVASIDTGSLTARRRLAEATPDDDPSRGTDELVPPGRLAVRDVPRSTTAPASRSVFDEPVGVVEPADGEASVVAHESDSGDRLEPDRVSALRRLIGGLRRR
ncbi:MAG: hypothetical protein HKN41_00655 [Ilumatobacter sp.]|nr:hypothetical protein [Ilumatobacter sp.]